MKYMEVLVDNWIIFIRILYCKLFGLLNIYIFIKLYESEIKLMFYFNK